MAKTKKFNHYALKIDGKVQGYVYAYSNKRKEILKRMAKTEPLRKKKFTTTKLKS
jgi:hypothetical protein